MKEIRKESNFNIFYTHIISEISEFRKENIETFASKN